jgi:hypothetical protein
VLGRPFLRVLPARPHNSRRFGISNDLSTPVLFREGRGETFMAAPSLTYREYAQVCSAFRALGSTPLSTASTQTLLAQQLRKRNPPLADRLSGLSAVEARTLLLHLWRYQESERLEVLHRGDACPCGRRRQA